MPFIKNCGGFVPVSCDFILNKMPAANAAYVKIYLYILAKAGTKIEYAEIATALSLLESDVVNAVRYWVEAGALSEADGALSVVSEAAADTAQPQPVTNAEEEPAVRKSDYTQEQVSDAVIANPALKDMMAVAEELLQKPLNPSEMESLYWFYDGLGLSAEAVLMLIEYCVSKGKPRLSYAEKVAVSWCERGLVTPEDISRYLRDSERKTEEIKQIMDSMGIGGRPPVNTEEQYFNKWLGEYAMSREMILLAHEYCMMQTAKLSFPYMDKILERWNSAGIHTTAAAHAEHDKHRSKNKKAGAGNEYEYTDLEQIMRGK